MVGAYNNYPGYGYAFDPYLKRSCIYANVNNQYVTYDLVSQIFASNAISIGFFHFAKINDFNIAFSVIHSFNTSRSRLQFFRAFGSYAFGLLKDEFGIAFFQTTANVGDGIRIIPANEYAINQWFYSSFSATMNGGQIDITPYNGGRRLSGKTINVSDSSSDSWKIRLCGDVFNNADRNVRWQGYIGDAMIWTRVLSDSEHAALADPDNVDLRVPGGPPLILHERTFWPGFTVQAVPPAGKKTPIYHLLAGCA